MTHIDLHQPYVIYLLHLDRPVSGKLHYCGSAKAERLNARLLEHRAGNGSHLTARAKKQVVGFTLVRAWYVEKREEEYRLKQNGHFKSKCPLCAPNVLVPQTFAFCPRFEALEPALFNDLHW